MKSVLLLIVGLVIGAVFLGVNMVDSNHQEHPALYEVILPSTEMKIGVIKVVDGTITCYIARATSYGIGISCLEIEQLPH